MTDWARLGALADLPAEAAAELPAIAAEVAAAVGEPTLAALAAALATLAPAEAIATVRAAALEEAVGVPTARRAYLVLALGQLDAAVERHRARGVDETTSRRTLSDLGTWVRHFQVQLQSVTLTIEILDWAQRYLRGDLLRLGALQFEVRPFGGPIAVYRRRSTGALTVAFQEEARDADRVDPRTGLRTGEPFVPLDDDERVLDPSSPVLDMHIPAGTKLGLLEFAHAIRHARAFHADKSSVAPVAACGEAWLLDPQMRTLLPKNAGLHALQAECLLYPSKLTEEKTIRRLFGPDVTRAMLPTLPREMMTSLHRAVVDLLADPAAKLSARGGAILWPEHDAILARVP